MFKQQQHEEGEEGNPDPDAEEKDQHQRNPNARRGPSGRSGARSARRQPQARPFPGGGSSPAVDRPRTWGRSERNRPRGRGLAASRPTCVSPIDQQ